MTDTEPALDAGGRIVVADRFPAHVRTPDGDVYDDARVVLTRPQRDWGAEVFVWTDTRPEPTLAQHLGWTPDQSGLSHRGPWQIAVPGGLMVVERGRGCGCGSPLKRLRPWTPWRMGVL